MFHPFRSTLPILVIASLVLSCKSSKTFTGQEMKKYKPQTLDYQYISLKGRMRVEDGQDKSEKATLDMRIQRDSLIWLSLRTATGIEGVRGLIDVDSFRIALKVAKPKQAILGSFVQISQDLGMQVDFELMEAIFTGSLPSSWEMKSKPVRSDQYFTFKEIKNQYQLTIHIGRKTGRPELIEVYDARTTHKLTVAYTNFQMVNEQPFPHLTTAKLQYIKDGESIHSELEIDLAKVKIADEPLSFPFFIPSKYQIVPLRFK